MSIHEAWHTRNRPRFVGRVEERRQLARAVTDARQGRGRAALVTGEAGVGKTRLLQEVIDQRLHGEAMLLRGYASPGTEQPVLVQVVDTLRGTRQHAGGRIWSAVEARARWLMGILPELAEDYHSPPIVESQLVFQCILDAVCEGARDAPIVWLLDDMQWADASTWSFLRYASRHIESSPLMLLAACRDDEIGMSHVARPAIVSLQDTQVLRIHLGRLSSTDAERLVRSLTNTKLTAEGTSTLARRSAGNPRAAADLARAALAGEAASVPASISLTVDQRAASLSTDARELLEVLAVLGVETDVELVLRLRTAAEVALSQLVDAGLIASSTLPSLKVLFRHPLFRDAVYERTAWTRRRLLHAEVADVLERPEGKDRVEALALAAHHRELSGDVEGAVRALRAGADTAREAHDARRAGALYVDALDAASRDPRLDHHRPTLMWAAIEQLDAAGRWAELLPLAAQAWALPLDRASAATAERARILGTALLMMGRVEEGCGLLLREAEQVEEAGEPSNVRPLLAAAAAAATYVGDLARSQRLSDMAASLGGDGMDPLLECVTIAQRFRRHRKRESSARAFHANGVRALRQGMLAEAAIAFWNHARMTTQIRDIVNAESVADRAGSMTGVLARLLLGMIHTLEGRPAKAARTFSRADSEVRATAPLLAPLLDGLRAHLHLQQGELTRARRLLKRWEGEAAALRSPSLSTLQGARGWLAWETGDLDEAVAQLKQCAEDGIATGYGPFESGPLLLPIYVDALLRLGRPEEAEQVIDETAGGSDFDRFFSAALAAASFRRRPSTPAAEEAQRAAAAAPWPFLEDLLEVWRGQLVDEAGAEARASDRFAGTPVEADAEMKQAARSFSGMPGSTRARAEVDSPLKMSRRELQIAHLIAEGLTNRAIAAQLALSPETVATHVKHILAKLGFNSRTQVATWLSEHRIRSRDTEALIRVARDENTQHGGFTPKVTNL